jgi:hypothetical protein
MNFFQRQAINLALAFGWKPLLKYLADKIGSFTEKSENTWDDAIGKGLKNAIYIFAEIEGIKYNEELPIKLRNALNKVVEQTPNQIDDVLNRHLGALIQASKDKDYNKLTIILAQITQEILSVHPLTGEKQ